MENTLDNIAHQCGGNNTPGFLGHLYIAREDEIDLIPAPDANTNLISGDITMRTADAGPPVVVAGTFKRFGISTVPGKNQITIPSEGDSDSIQYKPTGEFFIAGGTPEKSYILQGTKGCRFILILALKDKQKMILGDEDDGIYIKVEQLNNDQNGYKITFDESLYSHLPYYYDGAIVE